jgi:putative hydrolase of the HAD superfamily
MKPHRRIFQTALDRMDVTAERAMYVGDRLGKDVRGSGRVGMRTVLLSRSGRARLSRFRPDHIVQQLSELPPLLQA